jgi:hypothetical protein
MVSIASGFDCEFLATSAVGATAGATEFSAPADNQLRRTRPVEVDLLQRANRCFILEAGTQ